MNTLLRRFLLSAAFLLCCTATANAQNPDAIEIGGIYYILNNGNHTATVTWGGVMKGYQTEEYSGDITIPAKVTYESKEYTVTSIGASAFYMCRNLESITIPSGVTSIGASAFYKNYALTSITIPSGVTSIGDSTFYNCSKLATVTFAEGSKLESIGAGAFANSYALESITIPSGVTSIGASAFYNSYALESITIPSGVTSIGASAFYNSYALTSITIPSAVTSIGDSTFYNCSKLATVTFEEGSKLESIGAAAFYQNYALESITIPSGVTSIGASAFYINHALTSITIPSAVTSIGDSSFYSCNVLASVTFEEGSKLESIGAAAFYQNYALESITIPSGVTSIGASAFYINYALTSITIPSGVTSIGDSTFYNCSNLATVTFEEGSKLESIGAGAFANSYALESITIPSGVTSIGAGAFAKNYALESITIPSGVTSIGERAFAYCNRLKSIYVSWKAPLAISDNVFSSLRTSEITLHIPYGTLNAYSTANTWSTFDLDGIVLFADVNAEAISIENWDSNHDGLLSTKEAAAVTDLGDAFSNSTITSLNELKYFKNLTSIGDNAFKGTSITSIEIPATITSIGESAFENCTNLKAVTIPATVTSIGENAFKGCSGLEEIYVKVQSPLPISSNVFENVATTCLLRVPYGSVTSYKEADVWKSFSNIQDKAIQFEDPEVKAICLANWDTNKDGVLTYEEAATVKIIDYRINTKFSDNSNITSFNELKYFTGLKEIGMWAFSGCTGLTSITIPSSVTAIGSNAFEGCTELKTVSVQWTEADKIPDISGKNVFNGIALSDVTLNIPYKKGNIRSLYTAKDVWKDFNIDFAKNFAITKSGNTTIEEKVSENSDIVIDESNITKLLAVEDVPSVKSITYTRDFTNVTGKWQAWFVPFEAPVSVLNDASIDAAEIAGILLDDEGETIVAFKKIEGDSKKMHANTPYVVRMGNDAPTIATLVFENTNLKETAESEYYAMSMYDKFTFTGNYESKAVANSYALNTEGEFQKMANDAVLGPMRFSLAVTPRDDGPYGSSSMNPTPRPKISYMILGDDSSLQPIDGDLQQDDEKTMRAMTPAISLKPRPQQTFIYDLRGRKVNRIQSKQVYIIDGKKFIAR